MTARDKTTLKEYFNAGDVPSEQHYADLIDSFQDIGSGAGVATGAEIDIGTDNTKFASPKAIRDSGLISGAVSNEIYPLSNKTPPEDGDIFLAENSSNSYSKIKVAWVNIKSTLKSYFDTLYAVTAKGVTNGDSHDHNGGDGAQIDHLNLSNIGNNPHSYIDSFMQSGWISCSETWTYNSSTSVNVPSGAANKYSIGDKVKLYQTTGGYKYFYITGVADTVLTLNAGNVHSIINESISSNFYSKSESPVGFPQWFAFTPTWSSSGTQPTPGNWNITDCCFCLHGKLVTLYVNISFGSSSTYGTGTWYFAPPITGTTPKYFIGNTLYNDASPWTVGMAMVQLQTSTQLACYGFAGNAFTYAYPHTWAQNDQLRFQIQYQIP